jgi:hypothetical protein
MKVRQRVCFHSSGNRSSRSRSECALLCRTVAPHEDHEIIWHCGTMIALCQFPLKGHLLACCFEASVVSSLARERKRGGTPGVIRTPDPLLRSSVA